ncbi:MAG: N-acetyltransferase family protein [Paracoccaceae bacterium]
MSAPMVQPVIRPVEAGDEAEWRRLWGAYLAFYETELPDEVFRSTFRRVSGAEPGGPRGLIALIGASPVGLVHFLYHRTCWAEADTCYLQDLFVSPEARGTGLGRALIERVYAEADAAGASQVYWMTQEFNYRARMLYDRIAQKTPFIEYNRR